MKHMKKILSLMLVLCMVFSLTSFTTFAAEDDSDAEQAVTEAVQEDDSEAESGAAVQSDEGISVQSDDGTTAMSTEIAKTRNVSLDTTSFYRIFHLDTGRKYFSVEQVKAIIDMIAENGYNTLELAVGNDGLRFLLDDMSVTANEITYSSDTVEKGIKSGNAAYSHEGEWSEDEMTSVISYAGEKGISVIPLINTPGHMDAILSAMEEAGIKNSAYRNWYETSDTTIDVTNSEAVNFTLALVNKYIRYFANQGCKIFNMGADEYAVDVDSSSFAQMNDNEYAAYISFINNMAAQIQNAGMTAMAFNDGIYYNGRTSTSGDEIDTNIAVAYWQSNGTSATDLVNKGFKIINTNNNWYYVLGQEGGINTWASYNKAFTNVKNTSATTAMIDGSSINPSGAMLCVWCDNPDAEYSETEVERVATLASTLALSNAALFGIEENDAPQEDLSNVEPLQITRYISTYRVYDEGTCTEGREDGTNNIISISAEDAYSEEGIDILEQVPRLGDWAWAGDGVETVFWKGVVLDGIDQGSDKNTDYSMRGTDFSYVRYWNGQWQYSADRSQWITVQSRDYLNAYYLQKTEVTKEVDTYVKDWAYTPQNSAEQGEARAQKALSFAVVYPSGQLSPATEGEIYSESTLIYWSNLANLGFIRVGVNEVYEVERITYTMGRRASQYNNDRKWNIYDSITWEKVDVPGTDDEKWYDETECWNETYGTEPVINGADLPAINTSTWGDNDAVLILIYLKPVESQDSLTVRYWDNSTDSQIYTYPLNITNTSTGVPGTFLNRLNNEGGTIQVGEIELSDSAYVVNAANQPEYFEKDLTQINDLRGKYTSGLYNYVSADISSDGKTLTLHYDLDSEKLQPYYIADFGLPVEIPFDDLGSGVTSVTASVPSNANGSVSVNSSERKIVFTADRAYAGVTVLSVTATYEDSGTQMFNVGIYPATTVYYEETFASGDFVPQGTAENSSQQSLAYESVSDHSGAYNFGYDAVYADDGTGATNGTEAVSTKIGDDAVFSFTGTGVDIYANCKTNTGSVNILVRNADTNALVKLLKVDTMTGNGSTDATTGQAVDSYSLPIASINGLERGNYTVTIRHCVTDVNETETKPVYLDGFKVFGTLDESAAVYADDGEQNPNYVEIRNAVLKALDVTGETSQQVYDAADNADGAVIISDQNVNSSLNAQDLLDNGPKNEVFLRPGQTLTFDLAEGITSAQIGLKAINANVNYTINNGETQTLNTSADMFYELNVSENGGVSVTNTSGGILSITDLKYFGTPASAANAVSAPSKTTVRMALMSLGLEEAEPEITYADAVLNLILRDETGSELASTALTANGAVGETAVFAAADIEEAVSEIVPEGYNLNNVSYMDVEVAYGESIDNDYNLSLIETEAPDEDNDESFLSKLGNTVKSVINKVTDFFKSLFGR